MLAGLVVLGQSAGTYRFSELASAFASTDVSLISFGAIVLILLGAFTKSAQWPFSSWLPGAMVAPTPISTYLHAATMVKAGVFLLHDSAPVTYSVDGWRPTVFIFGATTMVFGGWRALRQVDLKVLLGVRNGESTRVHDDARGCWHLLAHPSPHRRTTRPRSCLKRSLHGRWRGRPSASYPRYPTHRWRRPSMVADLSHCDSRRSLNGGPASIARIHRKRESSLYTARGAFTGSSLVTAAILGGSVPHICVLGPVRWFARTQRRARKRR